MKPNLYKIDYLKKTKLKSTLNMSNSLNQDTQLIPLKDFKYENLVFSTPIDKQSPGGPYKQVKLSYKYDEKTIGPPIVPLSKKLCFGIQGNNITQTGEIDPEKTLSEYRCPLIMCRLEQPDPEGEEEINFFDGLQEEIARWAVENKASIGKSKKKDATLEDMVSPLMYRKKDEQGEYVDNRSPIMYATLIWYKKNNNMVTRFYGPGDKEVDPRLYTNRFLIEPNVIFDKISISNKSIKLKCQIYDATVSSLSKPMKRLAKKNEDSPNDNDEDNDQEEYVEEIDDQETGFED